MYESNQHRPIIARNNAGLSVAPSPFNTVKLELALILIGGLLVWLVHDRITTQPWLQLALLAGYGISGSLWLMVRARRVLRRAIRGHGVDPNVRGGAD